MSGVTWSQWLSVRAVECGALTPQDTAEFAAKFREMPQDSLVFDSTIQRLWIYGDKRIEEISIEKTGHSTMYHECMACIKAVGIACGGFLLGHVFRSSERYAIAFPLLGLIGAYLTWKFEYKTLNEKCGPEFINYKEFESWQPQDITVV